MNLCSKLLSFFGSIFMGVGLLLTNNQIDQISATRFGRNPFLADNLMTSRIFAVFGILLLIAGLAVELIRSRPWRR